MARRYWVNGLWTIPGKGVLVITRSGTPYSVGHFHYGEQRRLEYLKMRGHIEVIWHDGSRITVGNDGVVKLEDGTEIPATKYDGGAEEVPRKIALTAPGGDRKHGGTDHATKS